MKIIQTDAILLQNVVGKLLKKPMRPDLAKSIAILYSEIVRVVTDLQSTFTPVRGWDEYQDKRQALLKEIGTLQSNGSYSLSVEANKKLSEFDALYTDIISAQEQYAKDFQATAEKTTKDIDFEPINIESFDFNIEPGILVELMRCGVLKRNKPDGNKQENI